MRAPRLRALKQKWLTHFAAVTSADAPVNYGDFLLFTALELAISSFTAAVDESRVTGEAMPQGKRTGDRVVSGAIVSSGYVHVKTEAAVAASFH